MMSLDELSIKYGTDKGSLKHNYMSFYEKYLPENPKKILEIGVLNGASIRMWKECFPNAEIHGLDLFLENPIPEIEGVKFWQGSQTDPVILEQLRREQFDVVIEDGSHNSRDQLITFYGLYQKGMYYFVEDLHCCQEEFYRDRLPGEMTLLSRIYDEQRMDYPISKWVDGGFIAMYH